MVSEQLRESLVPFELPVPCRDSRRLDLLSPGLAQGAGLASGSAVDAQLESSLSPESLEDKLSSFSCPLCCLCWAAPHYLQNPEIRALLLQESVPGVNVCEL